MSVLGIVVALVGLQRLSELVYAARNTRALRAAGAAEFGANHYPLIVTLHLAWLFSLLIFVPWHTSPIWPWLGLYVGLQGARLWVIASLGRYWTTRIIVAPGAPLVRHGPYRWLHHPNYLVVACEIAVLPLAFGSWPIALVFTVLNAMLSGWRIRVEAAALGYRRTAASVTIMSKR
jgi:methyltransferase